MATAAAALVRQDGCPGDCDCWLLLSVLPFAMVLAVPVVLVVVLRLLLLVVAVETDRAVVQG